MGNRWYVGVLMERSLRSRRSGISTPTRELVGGKAVQGSVRPILVVVLLPGRGMRAGVAGCRAALVEARAMAAGALAGGGGDETLVAAALVAAVGAIDDVTGAAMGNDLLDRIFSRHCIGK